MNIEKETIKDIKSVYPKNTDEWRDWLKNNGAKEKAVYLIMYHQKSGIETLSYEESVEHALCYGWIDSKGIKRDDESSYLYFTPRKLTSKWSKPNKIRVERMNKLGLMTSAGQTLIDHAKKSGTWDALNDVDNGIIPSDLQKLFDKNKKAFENYSAFSPSSRRMILEWIYDAKKPETRNERVIKTVEFAEKNLKARG